MFLILGFCASLFVNTKLLNSSFYEGSLNKSKYYEYLPQEVNKGLAILSISTGIPQEVFTNTVNNDFLKEVTNSNIRNAVDYMKYNIEELQYSLDKDKLQGEIYSNLENYAKANNINLNSEAKGQLTQVSKDFVEITENHSNLFNMDAVVKLGAFQKFRKVIALLGKLMIPFLIGIIFFTIDILLLHKGAYRKSLLWIGSSFIPAGIIMVVPSIFALVARIPYRIGIGLPYLKEAVQVFVLGYINYFLMVGIITIAIGILLLVFYSVSQSGKRSSSY